MPHKSFLTKIIHDPFLLEKATRESNKLSNYVKYHIEVLKDNPDVQLLFRYAFNSTYVVDPKQTLDVETRCLYNRLTKRSLDSSFDPVDELLHNVNIE